MDDVKQHVGAALHLLGVDKLVLAIHDQSFPSMSEEEIGRGSPYSAGGRQFAKFISELGFNGIQFGPQGQTSFTNPSPYDSSLFSKNELAISLLSLAQDPIWSGLLETTDVERIAKGAAQFSRRNRSSYQYAWQEQRKILRKAFDNLNKRHEELRNLWISCLMWTRDNASWLVRDALFDVLANEYGTDDWRQWSDTDRELFMHRHDERVHELMTKYQDEIQFYNFCQFIAHQQHNQLRKLTGSLGLKLYADMQIGLSQRDVWSLRSLFLKDYLLGAPPSRTNPEGQPWGYPVLDPDQYFVNNGSRNYGPVLQWMAERIDKILMDFEGLRIDHPHGLICPWVYRSTDANALHAVQTGARLFESPHVEEHSELAKYAIAREEQLNTSLPRYADGWVRELTPEQVKQYATIITVIERRIQSQGFDKSDIICEVLSSCPYPLKAVMEAHKLGRFRVTQKADPFDGADVYRSDGAASADWIMVGTHDTAPIWSVVETWDASKREAWCNYLAKRLEPDEGKRSGFAQSLEHNSDRLVEAMFADLFVGPAKHVSVFFADLFGLREIYNRPGIVSDENWCLSVPNDYQSAYPQRAREGKAMNLPRILALALRAKLPGNAEAEERAEKLAALDIAHFGLG